jgi:carboxypeptidase A4
MIVVEAGLRARDWIANMAALRLVKELTDNSTKSDHVDWVVLPNINPDGYEFTRTTDRHWIKNRRADLSNASTCVGVGLNRNFDFNWAGSASSMDFCSDYYAGPWPMSEKELEALNTIFSTYDKRIKAYVSLQTAGSYILSPYFYTE